MSGGPGGSCWTGKLTEVASEGLLAPRAVDRVADGREGRDRLVLVVVLEENGQGPVAPHGSALEPNNTNVPNAARGIIQRNTGLKWIRDNVPTRTKGVVYFLRA